MGQHISRTVRVPFGQVTVKTPISSLMEKAEIRTRFGGREISGARFDETYGRNTSTFGEDLKLRNKLRKMRHNHTQNAIVSPSITVLLRKIIFPSSNPRAARENMRRCNKACGTQPTMKVPFPLPASHIVRGRKGVGPNVKNKFQKTI